MSLSQYTYKSHAVHVRHEKTLRKSRRLLHSAKLRAQRPPRGDLKPDADVDMAELSFTFHYIGRFGPCDKDGIPLSFPDKLKEPELPPAQLDWIPYFEPELEDVDPEYSRDALAAIGVRLMDVSSKCKVHGPILDSKVLLAVPDSRGGCVPSHVLSIRPVVDPFAAPPASETMNLPPSEDAPLGTVVPVHGAVLMAHCGRLPNAARLPESCPQPPSSHFGMVSGSVNELVDGYRVPLVPFSIPHPASFLPLLWYMYNHHEDLLVNNLVRMQEPFPVNDHNYPPILVAGSRKPNSTPYKRRLYLAASECTAYHDANPVRIHKQMVFVEGFWKNAIALAVSGQGLWRALRLSWSALVLAMKWSRAIRALIAEEDAERAAVAAREGRQVEDPNRADRHERFIGEYVSNQMKHGSGIFH